MGYKAGSRTRTHATSIGYQAGVAAYEHGFVAVGSAAGSGIGSYSVGVGYEAAHGDSSDYVVAVGHQAAKGSSGQSAVWIGNMAGSSSSSSTRSIGLGYQAGKSSSAEDSIYIGSSAGQSNTTDDLLYIGNGPPSSNRTLIKGDMQSKRVAIGAADVALNDTLLVGIAASTDKGLVVKSAAGQSANITEWQNFAGNTTASVDTNGDITANELAASGQGLHLHNLGAPPPTTSNRLYNYGGSLYFNLVPMSAPSGINTSVAFYGPGQSAVYSNDFTFDKSDVELTVGSVKIQQDAIEINEPGNTIRLGKYTIAPAIADSPYSIFLGMNAGVFASGLTSSVLLGHNAGWGMSDSYRSVAVGMQAGFYASGDRSIYLGENAGSRASGVHNVFIGYDAGRYCVGDQNIEIVASGESNSVLDGYSNKIHIGQTVIGDTDAKKLAFGLVSSGNVSPDATVEVFPKTDDLALKVHGSGEFASGIALPSAVPSTTSNMLYNDAGTLKFNGTILGDATTTQLNYVSGVAVYASGQSIANESDIATNTTNIATNVDNIVATSGIANYASGLAITNQANIATNTSNISTNTSNISTNTGDIVATSGIADYASGQAISNEADIATNVSNINTNTSNIAINANDIIATSGIANYASGQVALDSDNVAAVSGIANYASGQSIANEDDIVATSGIAAYASGQADASNLQKVTDRGATTTNNVTVNNLLIADGGTIGSASENNVLTIAADGNVTFVSGVIVDGNLTVRGDEVILDVQKVEVEDNTILLNKNVTGTPSLNAGLEIERGTSPNTVIRWNESSDIWDFTQDGTNYYEIGKYEDINAASGIANYASGQAIENESAIATNVSNIATNADDIVAVSGISHYASGLAITNETDIVATSGIANYASGLAISNEADIVATSGIANYASGQAIANESDIVATSGIANYASGQAIANETDIVASSGIANYASGQAIANEDDIIATSGIANYASGQAIANESDIVAVSGIGNYASGQAIANEDDIVAVSGIANYASGLSIENEANVAYASGQTIENESDIVAVSGIANYASGMQLNGLTDVSYGGTNLSRTILINNNPGSAPVKTTPSSHSGDNLGLGYQTLAHLDGGDNNIAISAYAGSGITGGSDNITVGYYAGNQITAANYNVFLGRTAAQYVVGSQNIAIGNEAMKGSIASSTTDAVDNIALGYQALQELTSGGENIAVGKNAGNQLTSGSRNIFIGQFAGFGHTSDDDMLYIANERDSSDGTLIKGDMANKYLAVGKADVTLSTDPTTLQVLINSSTDKGLIVKGAAAQSDNLQEWQASNSVAVATIDQNGNIASSGTIAASGGILIDPLVPSTTTNKLYNDGGTLKFNGSAVGGGGGGDVTTSQLNYVSGIAVYSSGQAIANESDIVATSGIANYASGQVISNESDIVATSGIAAYSSGQAIDNETDLVYVSGAAAYASGNTANIAFGSNAEGDLLYHNGTSFIRLAKGANDYILKMNGNVPNWEAESGGGGISWDGSTANGVATFKNSSEATVESNLTFDGNALTVATSSNSVTPSVIKGAASQTADLTSWQNSAGTSVAAMTASGTLNAYGIVASGDVEVSSSSLTPFSVDAGGRTGNSNFILKTGTGATDNQAILQVLGGTAGESRLYLGDSAVPAKSQLWYNNSNERFFLSANGATRMCIDENGRYMFSNRASSGGAGPPSVGYIDVVAHSGTIMCSGVRGHLLDNGTTDGTTQFDISQSTVHKITLDQDATFSVTNDRAGDKFMIRVLQDGTGGHSVTWWSTIKWAGNVVPTLSAANKADLLGFLCTGTNTYDGFIVGQDI